jgi:Ca2+-binding RTX toxin-like protein
MKNLWKSIYGTVIGSDGADNLGGGQEGNLLKGNGGDDHLYSDWGNDILIPGAGHDTLVFGQAGDSPPTDGIDLVLGYASGQDHIDLTALDLDFADLALTETHAGTLVDYGHGTIVLAGVHGLTDGDFLL